MTPEAQNEALAVLRVLAVNKSDEDAWRALYAQWWLYVLAVTSRVLRGERSLAEDAAQEVFLRLVRYCDFGKFDTVGQFRAYLATVAERAARDLLKSVLSLSESATPGEMRDLASLRNALNPTPEQIARGEELRQLLREALEEKDRALLDHREQGLTLEESAAQLGLSYTATAVRLHRLREKLRNYMTRKGL